jgi:hypothetical protein
MVRGIGRGNDPQLPGLEYRPSLAQLMTPEAAGINPRDYDDIQDYSIAEPTKLRASLIDVDREQGTSFLYHRPTERGRWVAVAVNPEDFTQIARSPDFLGKSVEVKTREGYPLDERYLPEKIAAAKRAGIHAVENKLDAIGLRLQETHSRREILEVIGEMALDHNINLRRSYAARGMFHTMVRSVIGEMVNASGIQEGYDDTEMTTLRRTIEKRLYVWPENVGPRVAYAGRFADLGKDYYGHLVMLYARKHYEARKYIRQQSAKLTDEST